MRGRSILPFPLLGGGSLWSAMMYTIVLCDLKTALLSQLHPVRRVNSCYAGDISDEPYHLYPLALHGMCRHHHLLPCGAYEDFD